MSAYPAWRRDGFAILTDPAATDLDMVCGFIVDSYWGNGLPRATLEQSVRAALVYNLMDEGRDRQVGFARVVTDHARIAWLSDVFVLEPYRRRGLGKWLVQSVQDDPRLAAVRRWLLSTADAHGLYRRCGWEDAPVGRYMQRQRR
ncbi:MAG TPA: GNAT family N-acetyltransferase [Geminicoccaceae bacterium]|nr:GNAT family N-acetyltransferase [Geminicoccaceae bacterium]